MYAGEVPASKAVLEGKLDAKTFRFFLGMLEWGPGQLQMEANSGIWCVVFSFRNLYLRICKPFLKDVCGCPKPA